MKNSFYSAFENKYRGSRDLIKSRLQVYLPAVEKLKSHSLDLVALDLGCGRGEWLEMVNQLGFQARGVDLDEAMLADCQTRGLNVEHNDALAALQHLPKNSVALITAFHVVEHLDFEKINRLIKDALRVLQPGGLLIFETPNPENILVSTHQFLLDPTHKKPIPMQLLSFLIEESGFARTHVLRLQEDIALSDKKEVGLYDVLQGVSPDYGVVAQKAGDTALMAELDDFFASSHGVSLGFLVAKYQKNLDEKFQQHANDISSIKKILEGLSETKQSYVEIQQLTQTVESILKTNADLERKIRSIELSNMREREMLKGKIESSSSNDLVMNKLFSCQEELKRVSDLLTAIQHSTSWKITAPMRFVGNTIKGNNTGPVLNFFIKKPVKLIINSTLNFINRDPKRKIALINFCKKTRLDKVLRPVYAFVLKTANLNKVMPQNVDKGSILDAKLSSYGKEILDKLNR